MNLALAEALIGLLPPSAPGLFNPWRQRCEFDVDENAPASRLIRLARHLDCSPKLILVGEAPGYQGCRYSGIAFTSERLLLEGVIPRVEALDRRLTSRKLPFSEPSATIVWKTLYRHGVAEQTILWNALQMHPFRDSAPWSNRTPSDTEVSLGIPAVSALVRAFPEARILAVGRKAEAVLANAGIPAVAVRHPANGGATEFAAGVARALA